MQVTIDIPDDIAEELKQVSSGSDLPRLAIERLALVGYLEGTLSRFQVQRLLGFDNRWDTEAWLGAHKATLHYTMNDLNQDRLHLDKLFGSAVL